MQVVNEKQKTTAQIPESTINWSWLGNKQGAIAGLLMGTYIFMLQWLGGGESLVLKMLKYIILGVILFRALRIYKFASPAGETFKGGLVLGARISVVAAIVFIGLHFITFFIGKEIAFDRFSLDQVTSFPMALLLGGTYLLETFTGGMILTFISLQYLKDRKPPA